MRERAREIELRARGEERSVWANEGSQEELLYSTTLSVASSASRDDGLGTKSEIEGGPVTPPKGGVSAMQASTETGGAQNHRPLAVDSVGSTLADSQISAASDTASDPFWQPEVNANANAHADCRTVTVHEDQAPMLHAASPSESANATATSSTSGTQESHGTRTRHGVPWSLKSPWGKGEVLHGRKFERVLSPEHIQKG